MAAESWTGSWGLLRVNSARGDGVGAVYDRTLSEPKHSLPTETRALIERTYTRSRSFVWLGRLWSEAERTIPNPRRPPRRCGCRRCRSAESRGVRGRSPRDSIRIRTPQRFCLPSGIGLYYLDRDSAVKYLFDRWVRSKFDAHPHYQIPICRCGRRSADGSPSGCVEESDPSARSRTSGHPSRPSIPR